jgi:hypothetical protein
MLGQVLEGNVNGREAYGGGIDTPYAGSKGRTP